MQHNDRLSEDVIKIFHNAKGSVRNNITKWTKNASVDISNEAQWKNHDSSFNHAVGESTHLNTKEDSNPPVKGSSTKSMFGAQSISENLQQATFGQKNSSNKDNKNEQSEAEMDDQIDDEQRAIQEGEARAEDIQNIRSSYEGANREQR